MFRELVSLYSFDLGLRYTYHCRCRQIRQYVDFLSILRISARQYGYISCSKLDCPYCCIDREKEACKQRA